MLGNGISQNKFVTKWSDFFLLLSLQVSGEIAGFVSGKLFLIVD